MKKLVRNEAIMHLPKELPTYADEEPIERTW